MKRTFSIFLLLCIAFGAMCQPLSTKSKKAKAYYQDAISALTSVQKEVYLKAAIKKDNNFVEAYWQLAQLYIKNKQDSAGIAVLRSIVNNPKNVRLAESQLKLAEQLYLMGNYKEAVQEARNISNSSYIRQKTDLLTIFAEAIRLKENPVAFEPRLLWKVSTPFDDYFPSITANEEIISTTVLVKSSPDAKEPGQEDIFWSFKKGDEFGRSYSVGKHTNTSGNEGSQSFSSDGRYMFFVACDRKENVGSCDIYYAIRQGDSWSLPINPGRPLNSEYWESNPVLSVSGDELFFTSNRPPCLGGKDIWHCKVQRAENGMLHFSQPENLGVPINTAKNDYAPFMHFDNQTLYFCSNGHLGLGRSDIFMSRRINGVFQTPVNLGYPINTHRDEFGFVVNAKGDKAYFASENPNSPYRDLDIYETPLYEAVRPKSMECFSGVVMDKITNKPLQATVEMFNQIDGKVSYSSLSDKQTGHFSAVLPEATQHGLLIQKKGYLFVSDTINAAIDTLKTFYLIPIMKGEKTILNNIFFAFNSFELEKKSNSEIDYLYQFLIKNPLVAIKIVGHTDDIGSVEYNKELSEKRAIAVRNALINKGIAAERIVAEGLGATHPVASNNTEAGRRQNRRVEFVIL
ncbi:MAG TPA: OmpA family protein [Paludibacteraceae bacterium]|nr:OmpA family protein [Paludibacteraceae bacterium]